MVGVVGWIGACSATPGGVNDDSEGLGSAPSVAGASSGAAGASPGVGGTQAASGSAGMAAVAGGRPAAGSGGQLAAAGTSSGAGAAGAAGAAAMLPPKPQSPTASWVYLDGYRVMVGKRASDGSLANPAPYKLKGVSWSPAGIGENNANGYPKLYTAHAGSDVPLLAGLHANTVKTYDPFERNAQGLAVLDQLYASGVMVVMQLMASKYNSPTDAAAAASFFRGHPAILAWLVGNEFNYNNLYGAASFDAALTQVNGAISAIHAADPDHPVLVSYGEIPSADVYAKMPGADIWAINLYPSLDLTSRFAKWAALSKKPMIVGEYGADAFNNTKGAEDQAAQASATTTLTQQIVAYYSANDPNRPVLGGAIYALSDEWWKSGNDSKHDNGGMNGAIYPDNFANEEWWGLTTVQREPRQAYGALASVYAAN